MDEMYNLSLVRARYVKAVIEHPLGVDFGINYRVLLWPWWPLLTACLGMGTVFVSWAVALALHLPLWLASPPISLTGHRMPERFIYTLGFCMTYCFGVITAAQVNCMIIAHEWNLPEDDSTRSRLHRLVHSLLKLFSDYMMHASLIGMVLQALIAYQPDTDDSISNYLINMNDPSDWAILHCIFAVMFYAGCHIHTLLTFIYLFFSRQRTRTLYYKFLSCIGVFLFLHVLPGFIDLPPGALVVNLHGLNQRISACLLLFFIADYSYDLKTIMTSHTEVKGVDVSKFSIMQ